MPAEHRPRRSDAIGRFIARRARASAQESERRRPRSAAGSRTNPSCARRHRRWDAPAFGSGTRTPFRWRDEEIFHDASCVDSVTSCAPTPINERSVGTIRRSDSTRSCQPSPCLVQAADHGARELARHLRIARELYDVRRFEARDQLRGVPARMSDRDRRAMHRRGRAFFLECSSENRSAVWGTRDDCHNCSGSADRVRSRLIENRCPDRRPRKRKARRGF